MKHFNRYMVPLYLYIPFHCHFDIIICVRMLILTGELIRFHACSNALCSSKGQYTDCYVMMHKVGNSWTFLSYKCIMHLYNIREEHCSTVRNRASCALLFRHRHIGSIGRCRWRAVWKCLAHDHLYMHVVSGNPSRPTASWHSGH